MGRYRKPLQAPLILLAILLISLLCIYIQWYQIYALTPPIDRATALWSLISQTLALVSTLVLTDRIAVHLLLITPRQRLLLLLAGTMLWEPLVPFFILDRVVWALPCMLISLYLQMLCYNRPDELQTLTLAGLMMGFAVLLFPPLLIAVPASLSILLLLKICRLRAYCAYLCGFVAILWLVLPTLYLLGGVEMLLSLRKDFDIGLASFLNPSKPITWLVWGIAIFLLGITRLGLEGIRGGSHVVTWRRQRALLMMASLLLVLAPIMTDKMQQVVLLTGPLIAIPLTPSADQLSRNTWYYLLPLLVSLVIIMQLLLADILVL